MPRSKYITGGIVFSGIWLIVGTIWLAARNSEEARLANIAARGSCRGQEDMGACLDAFYAANGSRPEIDWSTMALQLAAGFAVIWIIALLLKAMSRPEAD
jgi:hypothetical protein